MHSRSARAMVPPDRVRWEDFLIPEPLPVPADHPELDLWGITRVRRENEAEDAPTISNLRSLISDSSSEISNLKSEISSAPGSPSEISNLKSEISAEPLRARMLNEFVYCPRLFYYEQVEGVFVSNADTERGSAIHEKVDRGKGALPKARRRSGVPPDTSDAGILPADRGMVEGPGHATTDHAFAGAATSDLADLKTHAPEESTPKEETIHSRSAMLSSTRLGVVAKMDLIEVKMTARSAEDLFASREVQSVTPVDYKAGAPKVGLESNELWDADKMQLGLQILILRDNGYTCDEGVIYYRATKQRVPLRMTPELEAWIIAQIAEARELAASPTIPPPLVNSPKCVRCSLAPVCLPDETRMLAGRTGILPVTSEAGILPAVSEAKAGKMPATPATGGTPVPRRLIAARDDERALYLNTQGHRVGIKSERLVIKDGDSVIDEIRLNDVTHVALFGNIQLSTQAVQELCEQEIPVAYFSMGGWFYGLTRGHGLKNVHTRIQQFAVASNPLQCLAVAQKIVQAKIRNHRTMLMRLHTQPPSAAVVGLKEIAGRVSNARGLDELLGMEGAAAALYFQHFAGMIKVGEDDLEDEIPGLETNSKTQERRKAETEAFTFDFTHRKRRPPTDPVNALLSLAYSLLAKDCTIAALAVGFDPYVGFYHQPRHGRPALALDLMEEFRPLVAESAVLTAINNRMVTPGHFVRAGEAVNLTPHGRKAFFHAYEQRMNALITHPVFDYKVSYRRVLELQARLLARWLTGEIPDYVPMVTR
ncbi:CRISPR-associated endonuclease Cas1 [Prosthecobacter sp.]|uniref:CRISPR-associated endonuclease Cas4g/Cas1g n=1 Tax=Prosthecobacter sp. TaxID=1965333 RepID=UPI0025CF2B96|nr:CRISPR-associated endonuclease Cas1 [Prosthecobacter sp.]